MSPYTQQAVTARTVTMPIPNTTATATPHSGILLEPRSSGCAVGVLVYTASLGVAVGGAAVRTAEGWVVGLVVGGVVRAVGAVVGAAVG